MRPHVCVLLAAALLAGCTSTQSAGTAKRDTLRMAMALEPKTLNPILEAGSTYQITADLVFDPLLQYDDHANWIPALALGEPTLKNGGISRDGLHVTFHLRRDVRWQDGAAFTASDVRFTYEALLNPRNNVGSREQYSIIASMSTPDAYTIVFNLKRPRASILSDLWVAIIPAHLLANYESLNHVAFNGAPVGTGPFRVVEWKRGDHLTLHANERYWRGSPKLQALHVAFVPDAQTVLLQLKTGEADFWWNADHALLAQLAPVTRLRVVKAWLRAWGYLGFNVSDPILADVRVRRAIAQGIDFDRMASLILHDAERRNAILAAPFGWAYDPSVRLPGYDPAHAAALLDQAGWVPGPSGIRRNGGRELTLQLVYGNYSPVIRNEAVFIGSELKRIGIAVTHKSAPFSQLYATPENGGIILGGHFQLNLGTLVTNPDPDVTWVFACSELPPHGFNYTRWCSSDVDAVLRDARITYDPARRKRDYALVQRRLAEEEPMAFLTRGREYDVAPVWLGRLRPSPFSPFWNAWQW